MPAHGTASSYLVHPAHHAILPRIVHRASRQFRSIAEWIRDFTGGSVETHVRDWCEAGKRQDYPRITPLVLGGSNIFRLTRTFDCLWAGRDAGEGEKKVGSGSGLWGKQDERRRATRSNEPTFAVVSCRSRSSRFAICQLSSLFRPSFVQTT